MTGARDVSNARNIVLTGFMGTGKTSIGAGGRAWGVSSWTWTT
jgi:hypothetical protein